MFTSGRLTHSFHVAQPKLYSSETGELSSGFSMACIVQSTSVCDRKHDYRRAVLRARRGFVDKSTTSSYPQRSDCIRYTLHTFSRGCVGATIDKWTIRHIDHHHLILATRRPATMATNRKAPPMSTTPCPLGLWTKYTKPTGTWPRPAPPDLASDPAVCPALPRPRGVALDDRQADKKLKKKKVRRNWTM